MRFALGTRLGSPAAVAAPVVGEAAAWAARKPSSAGDVHELADGCLGKMSFPLCRNQSDSTES